MRQRLLEILLGLEPAPWTGESELELQWTALPSGDGMFLLFLALMAAVAGLWFLYRWEAQRLAWPWRALLLGLRTGIVLGVLAMIFEPAVLLSKREMIPSNLLVLVDNSRSMGLRDAWQNESEGLRFARELELDGGVDALRARTRLELVQGVLSTNFLSELALGGDRLVHLHSFSESLGGEIARQNWGGRLEADGPATSVGLALRQALQGYRGMPLAGVLVVSDGQSNSGEAPKAVAEAAAREGIPIVSVVAGTTDGPRNASLFKMEADPVVFVRDDNVLTVLIQSRGMPDQNATVTLERRPEGGIWEEVGAKEILLNVEGQLQEVAFDYNEAKPGKLEFRAAITETGVELTKEDNVALAEVRVIRQALRVLFIAGSTFPEVQFVRNAMMRDKGILVSTWNMAADSRYEHPGDDPIRRLPRTREELDEFDCVVLYDPDPALWPEEFPELLTRFVARDGGGLIFVAGEMQTARLFDRQDEPELKWLSLLPVVREPGLFRSEVQMRLSAQSAWSLDITKEGLEDPIFAFSDDGEENLRVIRYLPGMYWHFPVTRAKPGATVLARHGDPRMRNEFGPEVLLVTQLVGPGRAFFVGFDSTYRWRYLQEQYFDGFWARMVDRAGRGKQLGGVQPFSLTVDRQSYRPGAQVQLTARFRDPAELESGIQILHGEVEAGGKEGRPVSLHPSGVPGEFVTSFEAGSPGPHLVRVWAGDAEAKEMVKAGTVRFDVEVPNVEFENPVADRAALELASQMTGARTYELTEGEAVKNAFGVRRVAQVLEDRQEVWDAPLIVWTLFGLLLAEWILRKRLRMI